MLLFIQAAKRHLTQRIEKLDDKLDQQKALSGQIRDDVLFPLIWHTFIWICMLHQHAFTSWKFMNSIVLICTSIYINTPFETVLFTSSCVILSQPIDINWKVHCSYGFEISTYLFRLLMHVWSLRILVQKLRTSKNWFGVW